MLLSLEIVAKNEAALLGSMAVQVNVDLQVAVLVLLHDCSLRLVDRGLLMRAGIEVEPIQVVVVGVQPVVASSHAIWVQQGYDLELVLLKQNGGLLGLGKQEVDEAVEDVRALHLARVDSSRQENSGLVELVAALGGEYLGLLRAFPELREHARSIDLLLPLFGVVVLSCNRDQLDIPLFFGVPQQLAMEVDILRQALASRNLVFPVAEILQGVFVAPGLDEAEVSELLGVLRRELVVKVDLQTVRPILNKRVTLEIANLQPKLLC